MKKSIKPALFALAITATMMGFQNCSDVRFQDNVIDGSNKAINDNGTLEVDGTTTTTTNTTANTTTTNTTANTDATVCSGEPCHDYVDTRCEGADCLSVCSDIDGECLVDPTPQPEAPDAPSNDQSFACSPNEIQDIIVNLNRVEIDGQKVAAATGPRSLIALSTSLVVINDTGHELKGNTIRLVLEGSGNSLLDSLENSFSLKTPSAQQSGLKIVLSGNDRQKLQPNRVYKIGFELDVDAQTVLNKQKCLLKPVLHDGQIVEVET